MKFKLITACLLAVAGLGGATAYAASNPATSAAFQANFTQLQAAITSKDLAGYKAARTQMVNDRNTQALTKVNATTQEDLNAIADKQAKMKLVHDAITNKDYNAFKASASARMLARTPDQASFDKLVAVQIAKKAELAAVSEAIKNNNYEAYKVADVAEQNDLNRPNKNNNMAETDAETKAEFDQMVADYKADGKLPSDMKQGMGFGKVFGHGELSDDDDNHFKDDFKGDGLFGGGKHNRGRNNKNVNSK